MKYHGRQTSTLADRTHLPGQLHDSLFHALVTICDLSPSVTYNHSDPVWSRNQPLVTICDLSPSVTLDLQTPSGLRSTIGHHLQPVTICDSWFQPPSGLRTNRWSPSATYAFQTPSGLKINHRYFSNNRKHLFPQYCFYEKSHSTII